MGTHRENPELTVPNDDWVCRLVKGSDWNFQEGRPLHTAFRASNHRLSMWHVDRVEQTGCVLETLCLAGWAGAGEAHLQVKDCVDAAEDTDSPVFKPAVYWRPDSAGPNWSQWRDAHVQVESEQGNHSFPHTYRVALALRSTPARPPLTSS